MLNTADAEKQFPAALYSTLHLCPHLMQSLTVVGGENNDMLGVQWLLLLIHRRLYDQILEGGQTCHTMMLNLTKENKRIYTTCKTSFAKFMLQSFKQFCFHYHSCILLNSLFIRNTHSFCSNKQIYWNILA